ncbi:MAG: hypothetical protein CL610_22110 [Anaerolineaceae bacterium]|nr:hypothetical protein [Anaerolineaceae bacterium]
MNIQAARRWLNVSSFLGFAIWTVAWSIQLNENIFLANAERIFFFGCSVVTPLALRLALQPDRNGQISRLYRVVIRFQPFTTIAAGIALLLDTGVTAAGFAAVWQVQTVLLALIGLKRLLARPFPAIEEICVDVGLLYVSISGFWFVAYRAGIALLTFDPAFVLLTAVHFTFISLGALIIIGMVGRQLFNTHVWGIYRRVAWLAVISPLLVAIGISTSQFLGLLWVETGSVVVLASSFLVLTLLYVFNGVPKQRTVLTLLGVSSTALLTSMGFALAYSIGRLTNWWTLSLLVMVQWHGWLNAIGFTFCGLLAWNIANPETKSTLPGIPFSQLPWRWHIGPDFFQRIGAIEPESSAAVTGIIDRLQDYERDDFDPKNILPAITEFYENTAAHELMVYPHWQPYFGILGRLYKQVSKRIEQMNFPTHPDTDESRISSTIIPLKDALDGRDRVRGWVRVYTDIGQAVYVAAYASHWHNQNQYMNIAFPLPLGNLTSILRLEMSKVSDGGVLLTSYSTRHGDQGVYFSSRVLAIRLPINETIRVYQPDTPTGNLHAEHKMWLFGVHFLTLEYIIASVHEN